MLLLNIRSTGKRDKPMSPKGLSLSIFKVVQNRSKIVHVISLDVRIT